MKLSPLFAALALAGTTASALANDVNSSPPFVGNTSTFSAVHTAGSFTDTFTFSLAGMVFTDVSLITIGVGAANIDFTSGTLNGTPLTLEASPGGFIEILYTASPILATGPLSLVIKGISGDNASYSGTLNISAVPEPGSLALMLAGLGVVGYLARRRA